MLKGIFDEETQCLESQAASQCPYDMDAETLAVHKEVMQGIEDLIRNSLKPGVLRLLPTEGVLPTDDFFERLRKMMTHRLYRTYPTYEVDEGVSDRQILARREAIESGDIAALEHLRKTPCAMKWTGAIGTACLERRRMFNNLSYYLYILAHLAKRYDSRLAAQNFLRSSSLARKGAARLPMNVGDEAASEFITLVRDGIDELKVAADYFALAEWETFRAREAKALAEEDARVAAEEAKRENAGA